MNKKRTLSGTAILYLGVVFIIFFVFYAKIHPIVPFDNDDWDTMVAMRGFYPSMSCWNPTRLFPECLQPVVATISAFVITPMVGDYIYAMVYCNAFIVSLFILLFLYSCHRLLTRHFGMGDLCSCALLSIFVLFHFLILRQETGLSDYLWYSLDQDCYYYYTIPNLLCSSLVIYLISRGNQLPHSVRGRSILFILTYLGLCSNLFSTIILTAYVGAV